MRDGVLAAKAGLPSVAIVTEEFVVQADFIARAAGMPAVPRAIIEHPVSGTGLENIRRVADDVAPRLLKILAGSGS